MYKRERSRVFVVLISKTKQTYVCCTYFVYISTYLFLYIVLLIKFNMKFIQLAILLAALFYVVTGIKPFMFHCAYLF
jgi:hypothetical protein